MKNTIAKYILICLVSLTCNQLFAQIPIAQFTVNQTSVCAGFPITFTDQTNYQGEAIVSTTWDFGDGGQSTDRNPTYTYVSPGVYQVLLTAISASGTDTELQLNYITVNPLPTATIAGTTQICLGATNPNITFTGANGTAPYTFTYNINSGTPNTIVSTGNTATVNVSSASEEVFNYDLMSVLDATSTTGSQA